MKMEYVNVNGYLIPKLENGPITDNTIGKYGMMRARYLDEHRPMERDQMLLDGTLAQHLTNIDCEAHRQVESLTKVLAAEAKINEEMKRCNPLEWAAAMQGLQAQAEEIVCAELIRSKYRRSQPASESCGGRLPPVLTLRWTARWCRIRCKGRRIGGKTRPVKEYIAAPIDFSFFLI